MNLNAVSNLIAISHQLGAQLDLVQGGGGNISVKADGELYIKASGTPLKEMSEQRGWVVLGDTTTKQRPSMEWPMHQALTATWVCHTHPVYLNVFGCMQDGAARLKTILNDLSYTVLPYLQPGKALAQVIATLQPQPNIIILQNHGILVTGENAATVAQLTETIQHRCAAAMPELFDSAAPLTPTQHHYFPDAAVLSTNPTIIAANAYIETMILKLGGMPQPLSTTAVTALRNMEEEQYRITIHHS